MTTTQYIVSGMTCGHCASSVHEEVSGVDGVTSVDVNLAAGALTVHSDTAIDNAHVLAAVKEAGYTAEVAV